MPAFFDNKVIFPNDNDHVLIYVKVFAQPSFTSVYVDDVLAKESRGNIDGFDLGVGAGLKGKKIRIHTSVQDKNDNTDRINVIHDVVYNPNKAHREVDVTASEEGDLFDVFTDIRVF